MQNLIYYIEQIQYEAIQTKTPNTIELTINVNTEGKIEFNKNTEEKTYNIDTTNRRI